MRYFLLALLVTGCANPKLGEVMPPEGVKCKAEITTPDEEPPRGETIVVAVRIFDCR